MDKKLKLPPATRRGGGSTITIVSLRFLDNHDHNRLLMECHAALLHRNFAQSEILPDSSFCFLTQHSSFALYNRQHIG